MVELVAEVPVAVMLKISLAAVLLIPQQLENSEEEEITLNRVIHH